MSTVLSGISTSVTSVLLPGGTMLPSMAGEVLHVDSTATTYDLCLEPLDEGKCMARRAFLTQGPWAQEELPEGAVETGNLDFRDGQDKKTRGIPYSIHCDMTRTKAKLCYDVLLGEDDGEVTTRTHDPKLYSGEPEFGYAEVVLTAGLEKLNAKATDATTGGPSETASEAKETESEAKETGSSESGEDSDEDNNESGGESGVALRLPSVLAAGFAAGVTAVFAL